MTLHPVMYHTAIGWRFALVKVGRKYLHVVTLGNQPWVTVRKLAQHERRYMRSLDCSAQSAARHYLKQGRRYGITRAAARLLREAVD